MKGLFDATTVAEVQARLAAMRADSPRLWGKMSASQALAHCAAALEMALGDSRPPRVFIGRILGGFVKRVALGNDAPLRRNSPTAPVLVVVDQRDLDTERTRLSGLVDRFAAAGPAGCTTHPHVFFGRLTPGEWANLMYKHINHHLRQFGV